ncbi:hypothetical protein BHE74_00040569 [Ensete ventricosum]|nr:hypothetical protein GW17_00039563 [Ensete ventricosum]RWW52972.1 hypothetical protein BHE74_00040569 [Ensete ventricosum]RZS16165.1 hypothetical protein BHM03_00048123 [Ensete ventricosum]
MLRRAYSGITERSMTWGRGGRLRKFWRVGVSRNVCWAARQKTGHTPGCEWGGARWYEPLGSSQKDAD